jgi:hypothetical protein
LRKFRLLLFLPLTALAALLLCGVPARAAGQNAAWGAPSAPFSGLLSLPGFSFAKVSEGIDLGLAVLPESQARGSGARFVVLRIAPERRRFSLLMASEQGKSRSLPDWSTAADLRAGINASMYLPDNVTSTGYMRGQGSVNNANIGGKLGAFFVAEPRLSGLKTAAIIERDQPGWRDALANYDIVVQNFRLVNKNGGILWPEGGPEHSAAAVAMDGRGNVLFILCQEPLTPVRFAQYIQAFPLDARSVMYVEGGAQAGLFLRLDDREHSGGQMREPFAGASAIAVPGGTVHVWKGRQSMLGLQGNPQAVVPNILGVTR